MVLHGRFS